MLYLPAWQAVHTATEVAAAKLLNLPATQAVQKNDVEAATSLL